MIIAGLFTTLFATLAVMCGLGLVVLVYLDHRSSRIDDSIAAFRKHIDALSPEARRSSIVRPPDDASDWRQRQ